MIKFVIVLILSFPAYAFEVDIIDNKDNTSTLVLTDDCGVEHKLDMKNKDIGKDKELKFLKKLMETGEYNKCLDI